MNEMCDLSKGGLQQLLQGAPKFDSRVDYTN